MQRRPLYLTNIAQKWIKIQGKQVTHFPEVQEIGDKAPYFILLNHKFRVQVQIIRRYNLQEKYFTSSLIQIT